MKPNHQVESVSWLSRHDNQNRRRRLHAGVIFEFQPRRRGGFSFDSGGPARRPGFTRLARELLRADASRTFGLETAVLGFVTLVSAWSIAIMIREVVGLLR